MMLDRVNTSGNLKRRIPRARDSVQFVVAAGTTRFWSLGEGVERGQLIGRTVDGDDIVFARAPGQVVGIQYDVETDELILTVEPL